MVKFVSDSSINLLDMPSVNFSTAPLTIFTDERTFMDDQSLNLTEMLDYLAAYKHRSYTACPTTEAWLNAFEGGDEIYAVTLTSGLSGTFNSAVVARDIYLADHPEAKILIIDSLSVGPEMLLLMEKMIELNKEGKTFEEITEFMKEYQKQTRLFFAFRSVHNLAQNGRIPKIAASAIGIIGLSIIGTASEEGEVKPTNKARGEKKVLATLFKEMEDAGYRGGKLRISHVENSLLAVRLAALVQTKYPKADVKIDGVTGVCGYYCERLGLVLACECQ